MATVRGREALRGAARAEEPGVWMEGRAGKSGRIAHLWMPAPSAYTHVTAICGAQAYRRGLEPTEPGVHHCKLCERLTGVDGEDDQLEVELARGGRG